MCWWIRSSYVSGCLWLSTAIRDGSLKTDLWIHCAHYWDASKTCTAPYHLDSDGMVERFNRTCLMMLSMFVNDRRDNWHELLPFVMHAYCTSVHESTGYSPFRLMMEEEWSLPQDVTTDELRTNREHDVEPHPFATWVRDALEVAYDNVRHSLQLTAARRKRLYDVKAVNRNFPVGSWVLRYYPPAAE